jgi:MtN3 and saliva related transmembrane protein
MQYGIYVLGILAAALTSLSYLPQLQKAVPRNSTSDLSLKMLVALSAGLCLWVVYGVLKGDWVITLANSIGATLSLAVLGFKMRDLNSRSLRQISCSNMQPEKACDKEDNNDDADDVENVHGVLRLRHSRFQHETTALQRKRPGLQVSSIGHRSRRRQRWSIRYRLTSSNGHTIDSGRVTTVAAAPHSVSPAF